MAHYYQGFFKPKNPNKYVGDVDNIVYRSSWELKFMTMLDTNPKVLCWQSEEFHIKYVSPVDKKLHRYFPDFRVKLQVGDKVETVVIEIKPREQRSKPVLKEGKRNTKAHKRKVVTYYINQAKWKAAQQFCEERGWKFVVYDEKDLQIKW